MRRPVSDGMLYAPKLSTCFEAQEIEETAMKKVSSVATKQSRKISEQKLTVGLDLRDRWSWYCVLDESGVVVLEQRLSTTRKTIGEVFGGMPRSRIALETGMPGAHPFAPLVFAKGWEIDALSLTRAGSWLSTVQK
jgi:hypothetical protein